MWHTMVTEISPVFGMSLTALIEMATIIGAVVGIGAAAIIAKVIHDSNMRLLEHHKNLLRQQKKVDSAKLSLRILETWGESKHPKFTGFLDRLERSKVTKDDPDINLFLDEFENIAVFRKDGTLTQTHVREFFSTNLKQIRDNPVIQDYLNELENNHSSMYDNLRALLKTV